MNSSIQLCQSPLPVAPGRLFPESRVHVSLSHGSLSVSQSSKPSHLVSSSPLLHMNSRLHKMNEDREEKNIARGERGASLAMACGVFGGLSLSGKMKHKPPILAYAGQCSNADEGSVTRQLKKLVVEAPSLFKREPGDNEVEALKLYAMALSKDHPKEAQEILCKERQHWADGVADDKLLMALVELLVYQEDYNTAREKIEELREIVKAHMEAGMSTSGFEWRKFYLLKAIVESVNEARQKLKEEEDKDGEIEVELEGKDDTNKPKEEMWLIYCRKINEGDKFRIRPMGMEKEEEKNN